MVTCFDVGGGFLITASSSRVFVCTFHFSIFGALCMCVAVCLSIVCTFMSYWKLLYVLYKYKIFSLLPIWAHNLWNKAAEAYALIKAPSTYLYVCAQCTLYNIYLYASLGSTPLDLPSSSRCHLSFVCWLQHFWLEYAGKRSIQYHKTPRSQRVHYLEGKKYWNLCFEIISFRVSYAWRLEKHACHLRPRNCWTAGTIRQ